MGPSTPHRPAGVDPSAQFDAQANQWAAGQVDPDTGLRTGRWRSWATSGALLEDGQYEAGLLHGAVRQHVVGPSPFADARVQAETGLCEHGVRVGLWELLGADGQPVGEVDYGRVDLPLELFEFDAWSNEARRDWSASGRRLVELGQVRAGLMTLARGAAVEHSVATFAATLRGHRRVLKDEVARDWALRVQGHLPTLASALLDGAHPALLLGRIATTLEEEGQSRAALDFVNTAISLAPDEPAVLFTRVVVLGSLGLKQEAERETVALAELAPEQSAYLMDWLGVLFPSFSFTPTREASQLGTEGTARLARSLDEVRDMVGALAARLAQVRAALLTLVTEANTWLPPELSRLLPSRPQPLPPELTLDLAGADVPALLKQARYDWAALVWLLWAAGERGLDLPKALNPPKELGFAVGAFSRRLARARARARGERVASGEKWEGHDLADLHPSLAAIAEVQYAGLGALLQWLTQPGARTPWQDVRGAQREPKPT